MDLRSLRRPVANLISFSARTPCIFAANTPARRNESSYRRAKKRLNIKPEESFLYNDGSPEADHIIFNPPSAAPSVLHTPLTFLPKDDPRRRLFANAMTSTLASPGAQRKQGPILTNDKPTYQRHHLSETDVTEMRRLRAQHPEKWTSHKLAKKFNCSPLFVGMCCEQNRAHIEAQKEKLEAIKARWGPRRTMAREDRVKRREAVWRGE